MKFYITILALILIVFYEKLEIYCENQTLTVSPIFTDSKLPFEVEIELENFILPNGIQDYVAARYCNKLLLLAGRTNGLHGFSNGPDNFPPSAQNTDIYVIDLIKQTVVTKSLYDASSGLNQIQIDLLSVTSAQSYQDGNTLYLVGGYGIDTLTGQFNTKSFLTAIDVPGLIHWVTKARTGETAVQYIRQIANPIFQVTGGYLTKGKDDQYLLIFGQNFESFYTPASNGAYTEQIRRFKIHDNGKKLCLQILKSKPQILDPNYRRRDLNVVPVINLENFPFVGYVAFSGVFTESGGAWTVPVMIDNRGNSSMADIQDPKTFKQGMNNYVCPTVGLYSRDRRSMYVLLLGGISYGYFQDGQFFTDAELPFINQCTAIKMDRCGQFQQYLLKTQYPLILSTFSNPGNPLLFGAAAQFFPANDLPRYKNGVIKLEKLGEEPILLGHIIGGIQSTLPNTHSRVDSSASPYIFRVILKPR